MPCSRSSEAPSSWLARARKVERRVVSSAAARAASARARATCSPAIALVRCCIWYRSTNTRTLLRSTSGITGDRM